MERRKIKFGGRHTKEEAIRILENKWNKLGLEKPKRPEKPVILQKNYIKYDDFKSNVKTSDKRVYFQYYPKGQVKKNGTRKIAKVKFGPVQSKEQCSRQAAVLCSRIRQAPDREEQTEAGSREKS